MHLEECRARCTGEVLTIEVEGEVSKLRCSRMGQRVRQATYSDPEHNTSTMLSNHPRIPVPATIHDHGA